MYCSQKYKSIFDGNGKLSIRRYFYFHNSLSSCFFLSCVCAKVSFFLGITSQTDYNQMICKVLSNIRLQKKWLCFFFSLAKFPENLVWIFIFLPLYIQFLALPFVVVAVFLSEIYLFAFWMVWIFGVARAKKNRRWRQLFVPWINFMTLCQATHG